MTSLFEEEENYVRMGLLLTGISPRAARALFDKEFAPSCLEASLRQKFNKLKDLKDKKYINQNQWYLLFPSFPDVPMSSTFDVTLIITLLRNLTNVNSPHGGFDKLPTANETTTGSDLARIKYYRNYVAHLDDAKIDNDFFISAWDDISQAIFRVGGQSLKQECDQLKTKILDQTNKEIILEIKTSKSEIEELKSEMKKLKAEHDEVIPKNIRDQINKEIKDWKERDLMFVSTRASDYVKKCVQDNSCVTLTGSAGVGKSCIARHTALVLLKEGYSIIPVYSPSDIRVYYQPDKRTVFIVDDICGNFTVNQQQIENWVQLLPVINTIVEDKCCKVIVSCRLQVFKDDKFNILAPFKSFECNLISEKLCLTFKEKNDIASMYIGINSKNLDAKAIQCDFFPLLCSLYDEKKHFDVNEYFKNPFGVYKTALDKLSRCGEEGKYKVCGLALCVIFNNRLAEKLFQSKVTYQQRQIIEDTCDACRLNRGTSKAELKAALSTLEGTFIRKKYGIYTTLHDKLFDFLAHYFGQKIIQCLIEHGDKCLIEERFVWQDSPDDKNRNTEFMIEITDNTLEAYLKRLLKDWSNGMVIFVFGSKYMKVASFRQHLLHFLKQLKKSEQVALINTKDTMIKYDIHRSGDYPLIRACKHGYIDIVQWILDNDVDVDQCKDDGVSAMYMACQEGYTTILNMLLEKKSNVDICNGFGESVLYKACQKGSIDIVKLLLESNSTVNLCDNYGFTPLITSCIHNNISIVQLLLQHKPDINAQTHDGSTALYFSALYGHVEIAQLLLVNQADCNLCIYNKDNLRHIYNNHKSKSLSIHIWNALDTLQTIAPLNVQGYFEKKQRLYDRVDSFYSEENTNKAFDVVAGSSPLHIASFVGREDVVRCLLKHKYNINKANEDGKTPLSYACELGHTDIVKLLLEMNSNVDQRDNEGCTPLIKSSFNNHTSTVQLLIKHKPDINARAFDGGSALFFSAINGNLKNTQLLLDNSADCNMCFNSKDTFKKHALLDRQKNEILNILVHNTSTIVADYVSRERYYVSYQSGPMKNTFYSSNMYVYDVLDIVAGSSPLHVACFIGKSDVVRCLLEHKANINMKKEDGTTPLSYACELGHDDVVKMLLEKNANVNFCDKNGTTPLIKACMNNHTSTVQLLMKHKSYINARTFDGTNALFFSALYGNLEITKLLLEINPDCNNCIDSTQLIDGSLRDPPKETSGKTKRDFFYVFANCTSTNITQYVMNMMKNSKSLIDAIRVFAGSSALHLACFNGRLDVVRCLIENKANIDKANEHGSTPLSHACELGHTDIVKTLLDQNSNVDICDNYGFTPLSKACINNHNSIVQLLIKHKSDINAQTCDGRSALFFSALNGNLEITQLLLENGADCNICFHSKNRIINTFYNHALLSTEKYKIFKSLVPNPSTNAANYVNRKFSVYKTKKSGNKTFVYPGSEYKKKVNYAFDVVAGSSPLHIASFMGWTAVVRCLLKHTTNINMKNEDGTTPLSYACELGHTEIARFFLEKNANIDICDNDGFTSLIKACMNNNTSVVQLLIKHKPDINARTFDGGSALFFSALNGNLEITQILLQNNADCNVCIYSKECIICTFENHTKKSYQQEKKNILDSFKNSSSSFVQQHVRRESVLQFLNKAFDNVVDVVAGSSILHIACLIGGTDVVRCLLNHTANINMTKEDGTTPLYYACELGHTEIVQILLEKTANVNFCDHDGFTPLIKACLNNNISIIQLLIKYKSDINARTLHGLNALFFSALNGNLKITQILLQNNADCNICIYKNHAEKSFQQEKQYIFDSFKENSSSFVKQHVTRKLLYQSLKTTVDYVFDVVVGSSPIHIACFMGWTDVVRCLLEHKANINMQKEDGTTPLYYACELGHTEIVQILLAKNANVNFCDHDGFTPLIKACMNNNTNVVQLLIKQKPDINARALHGLNAILFSAINGNLKIIQLLLKNGADCNICSDNEEYIKDALTNHEKKTLKQIKKDIFDSVNNLLLIANENDIENSVINASKKLFNYDSEESLDSDSDESTDYDSDESADNDSKEAMDYHSKESGNYDGKEAINFDSEKAVDYNSKETADYDMEAVNYNSHEAVGHDSQEAVDHESDESVIYDRGEAIDHDRKEAVDHASQEAVDHASQEAVDHDSQDAVDHDSQEAVDHDSQKAVTQDNQEAVDHDSQKAVDHDSQEAVDHDSQEAVDHDSQKAVDHDSQKAVDHDSQKSVDHGSQEAVEHASQEAVDHDSQKAVDHDSQKAVDHDSQKAVDHGSQEAVEHASEEAVDHDSQKAVDHDSQKAVDHGSQEAVEHASEEAVDQDSQKAVDHDSQEAVEYDSQEAIYHESEESVIYDSQEAIDRDRKEAVDHDSQEAVDHDSQKAVDHASQEAVDYVFDLVTSSSPLHVACCMGRKDVVRCLLAYKANINMAKEDGTTPLFHACEVGHQDIVRLLLDKGADTMMCRLDGKSPFDIATDNGHESVVIMLRKHSEDQQTFSR